MSRHPRQLLVGAALLLVALAACAPAEEPDAATGSRLAGSWRAVLRSPGGDLPFGLEIAHRAGVTTAEVINGEERVSPIAVAVHGDEVTFAFEGYDSRIEARLDGDDRLGGRWSKTVPGGVSSLEFAATRGGAPRFAPPIDAAERWDGPSDVDGVWRAIFTDADGSEPARGELRQHGSEVLGTFLTPTGDYRFLAGSYVAGQLRLSTFDGAHAFLFHASARPDGSLTGDFWSRDSYHATWTAERVPEETVVLPDPWRLAGPTGDDGRFRFAFEDLEGRLVSSEDPRFAGKVVLVNLFGSWCPNCNDEAPLLARWHRRWAQSGLEIVGLAYEFSGDVERDRRFVRSYAERHGIDFPLLLAGTSDKREAAATLPDLTAVVAYPTSVFIGRDGRVRRIHSGFAGPATGRHHDELVAELEGLIESLLREPPPA